jgi:hypothetical protein
MKWNTSFRLLAGALVALAAQAGFAQAFVAPAQIEYDGKIYKQVTKQEKAEFGGLYEYTTGNEPIENWTSLITLLYKQGDPTDPATWRQAYMTVLATKGGAKTFYVEVNGEHVYGQIIHEPDAKNPDYEVDVNKSFHLPACGGLVSIMYGVKHPNETPPAGANPKDFEDQQFKRIGRESNEMMAALKASAWTPKCGKAPD